MGCRFDSAFVDDTRVAKPSSRMTTFESHRNSDQTPEHLHMPVRRWSHEKHFAEGPEQIGTMLDSDTIQGHLFIHLLCHTTEEFPCGHFAKYSFAPFPRQHGDHPAIAIRICCVAIKELLPSLTCLSITTSTSTICLTVRCWTRSCGANFTTATVSSEIGGTS